MKGREKEGRRGERKRGGRRDEREGREGAEWCYSYTKLPHFQLIFYRE